LQEDEKKDKQKNSHPQNWSACLMLSTHKCDHRNVPGIH
jgi:hypothetical protein